MIVPAKTLDVDAPNYSWPARAQPVGPKTAPARPTPSLNWTSTILLVIRLTHVGQLTFLWIHAVPLKKVQMFYLSRLSFTWMNARATLTTFPATSLATTMTPSAMFCPRQKCFTAGTILITSVEAMRLSELVALSLKITNVWQTMLSLPYRKLKVHQD